MVNDGTRLVASNVVRKTVGVLAGRGRGATLLLGQECHDLPHMLTGRYGAIEPRVWWSEDTSHRVWGPESGERGTRKLGIERNR